MKVIVGILAQIFLYVVNEHFVASEGIVEVELVKFTNTHHKDHGNDCCDTWPWGNCRGKCDTRIKICIGGFANQQHRIPCNLGSVETKEYDGQSTINFNNDLGNGLKNPMKFKFQQYPKYLDALFTVYDIDTWPNRNDLIDIHSDIFLIKPSPNESQAKAQKSVVKGRVTTIEFNVKVYCTNGFKGDECSQK